MIKLIATDVDGTLVKDSAKEVYPELIETMRELQRQGILVTVASGRQYHSIRRMFRELGDSILYIAENGAHITYEGTTIGTTRMDSAMAREIIEESRKLSENCHVIVSTPTVAYVDSNDEHFIDLIENCYCNKVELIDDLLAQPLEIIKIAIYRKDGMRTIAESSLIPQWDSRVKVCMAGEQWLDFMDKTVDKGHALRAVQERFHITPEETMAFGDNNNDIGLLCQAKESYAVETAVPEVKEVAKYICPSYVEKGVYQVLKERFL